MKIEAGSIGTLAELDVKPGDVVEQLDGMSPDGNRQYFVCNGPDPYGASGPWLCKSRTGDTSKGWSSSKKNCRLISRAATTPPIDLTAITTPFGLLDKATQDALRDHGGPVDQYTSCGWRPHVMHKVSYHPAVVYRVKPGPKREAVTNREMYITTRGTIAGNAKLDGARPVTITYDTIDGVIDPATYRVVAR